MGRCSIARWILAGLLALAPLGAAHAQSVQDTGRGSRDWREGCEAVAGGRQVCFIYQRLQHNARNAANVTVGYKPYASGPVLVVNLPLGVILLPEGLRIDTDRGVDGWMPFRFCDQRGCHAELELEPRLLQAMREGSDAWLVFRDLREQQIRLPVSLRGFTAALGGLRR